MHIVYKCDMFIHLTLSVYSVVMNSYFTLYHSVRDAVTVHWFERVKIKNEEE